MSENQIHLNAQFVGEAPYITQVQKMEEIKEQEELEEVQNLINKLLTFAVEPKVQKLVVLPKFLTTPPIQKFHDAIHKFEKYYNKDEGYIIYADNESVFIIHKFGITAIWRTRSAGNIYSYEFKEPPFNMIFPLSLLTESGKEIDLPLLENDIVKEFFSIHYEYQSFGYRQGHLYALPILMVANFEKWAMGETTQIYNHKLTTPAKKLTPEIYYINSESVIVVSSKDHGTNYLPPGAYLLYHPEPQDTVD